MSICLVTKIVAKQRRLRNEAHLAGFTLVEILIAIAIIGIMAAIAAPYINFGIDPLQDAARRIASNFRLVRSMAISNTSAYRISQVSATQLQVQRANSCSAAATAWVTENSFTPSDLSFTEASGVQGIAANEVINIIGVTANGTAVSPTTNWSLCYSSRGVAYNSQGQLIDLVMTIQSLKTNKQTQIEALTGGGVQVCLQPSGTTCNLAEL